MKRYIKIFISLIFILTFSSCLNNKKISLPEAKDLVKIDLIDNKTKLSSEISDKDKISNFIEDIKVNSKATSKESINDQPTNVDTYIIIKFYHKNSNGGTSIGYVYKKKNTCYIEQPYSGIWKLKDKTFYNIQNYLD